MADFDKPQSRHEALLQNILGANNIMGVPQSPIEKIWQYALGKDVELELPPQSPIEELAIQIAEILRNGGGGGYTPEQVQQMINAAILDYQTNTEPGHINDAVDAAILDYQTNTEPDHIADAIEEATPAIEAAAISDYQTNVEPGHIADAIEEATPSIEAAAITEYQTNVEPGHIAAAEAAAVANYEEDIENGTY